jgi:hypothetical protein
MAGHIGPDERRWQSNRGAARAALARDPSNCQLCRARQRAVLCFESYQAGGNTQAEARTEYYDALIVAVGCYSEPNLPTVPGMDATPAFQMHCHNYRSPERFAGQTVLVVGASFSGAAPSCRRLREEHSQEEDIACAVDA